ncbi:MAG: hypothetical protein KC713_04335 [Candidatus Omnitrophica bacterium]|nr:hypothetical protein [Candidatus Omnitrophota bacterium]
MVQSRWNKFRAVSKKIIFWSLLVGFVGSFGSSYTQAKDSGSPPISKTAPYQSSWVVQADALGYNFNSQFETVIDTTTIENALTQARGFPADPDTLGGLLERGIQEQQDEGSEDIKTGPGGDETEETIEGSEPNLEQVGDQDHQEIFIDKTALINYLKTGLSTKGHYTDRQVNEYAQSIIDLLNSRTTQWEGRMQQIGPQTLFFATTGSAVYEHNGKTVGTIRWVVKEGVAYAETYLPSSGVSTQKADVEEAVFSILVEKGFVSIKPTGAEIDGPVVVSANQPSSQLQKGVQGGAVEMSTKNASAKFQSRFQGSGDDTLSSIPNLLLASNQESFEDLLALFGNVDRVFNSSAGITADSTFDAEWDNLRDEFSKMKKAVAKTPPKRVLTPEQVLLRDRFQAMLNRLIKRIEDLEEQRDRNLRERSEVQNNTSTEEVDGGPNVKEMSSDSLRVTAAELQEVLEDTLRYQNFTSVFGDRDIRVFPDSDSIRVVSETDEQTRGFGYEVSTSTETYYDGNFNIYSLNAASITFPSGPGDITITGGFDAAENSLKDSTGNFTGETEGSFTSTIGAEYNVSTSVGDFTLGAAQIFAEGNPFWLYLNGSWFNESDPYSGETTRGLELGYRFNQLQGTSITAHRVQGGLTLTPPGFPTISTTAAYMAQERVPGQDALSDWQFSASVGNLFYSWNFDAGLVEVYGEVPYYGVSLLGYQTPWGMFYVSNLTSPDAPRGVGAVIGGTEEVSYEGRKQVEMDEKKSEILYQAIMSMEGQDFDGLRSGFLKSPEMLELWKEIYGENVTSIYLKLNPETQTVDIFVVEEEQISSLTRTVDVLIDVYLGEQFEQWKTTTFTVSSDQFGPSTASISGIIENASAATEKGALTFGNYTNTVTGGAKVSYQLGNDTSTVTLSGLQQFVPGYDENGEPMADPYLFSVDFELNDPDYPWSLGLGIGYGGLLGQNSTDDNFNLVSLSGSIFGFTGSVSRYIGQLGGADTSSTGWTLGYGPFSVEKTMDYSIVGEKGIVPNFGNVTVSASWRSFRAYLDGLLTTDPITGGVSYSYTHSLPSVKEKARKVEEDKAKVFLDAVNAINAMNQNPPPSDSAAGDTTVLPSALPVDTTSISADSTAAPEDVLADSISAAGDTRATDSVGNVLMFGDEGFSLSTIEEFAGNMLEHIFVPQERDLFGGLIENFEELWPGHSSDPQRMKGFIRLVQQRINVLFMANQLQAAVVDEDEMDIQRLEASIYTLYSLIFEKGLEPLNGRNFLKEMGVYIDAQGKVFYTNATTVASDLGNSLEGLPLGTQPGAISGQPVQQSDTRMENSRSSGKLDRYGGIDIGLDQDDVDFIKKNNVDAFLPDAVPAPDLDPAMLNGVGIQILYMTPIMHLSQFHNQSPTQLSML